MSCEKQGIIPVRLPAVDGSDPDVKIPEKLVKLYWDSTLNATFDHRCAANKMTVMSTSERACAWSHVKAWRMIADGVNTVHTPSTAGKKRSREYIAKEQIVEDISNLPSQDSDLTDIFRDLITFTYLGGGWRSGRSDKCATTNVGFNQPLKSNVKSSNQQEEQTKYYLIMEDDADFVVDKEESVSMPIRCYISDVIRRLPECDICYLGYSLPMKCDEFESGFYKPKYLWQLHGYLLSVVGAKKLLSALPVDAPVDNFIVYVDLRRTYKGKLVDKSFRSLLKRYVS